MDWRDLLKGFFGFPIRRGYALREDNHDWCEQNEEQDSCQCQENPCFKSGADSSMHFDVWTNPLEMERFFDQRIDEMMKRFAFPFGGGFLAVPPTLEPRGSIGWDSDVYDDAPTGSRDFMLKEDRRKGYEEGNLKVLSSKEDKDVDIVGPGELEELYEKPGDQTTSRFPEKRVFSYKHRSSHSIRHLPDGMVEERQTMINDNGHSVNIHKRQIGDQSVTTTTILKADGSQERKDDMLNMEEKDLDKFNHMWNRSGSNPSLTGALQPREEMLNKEQRIFGSLFNRFFGDESSG